MRKLIAFFALAIAATAMLGGSADAQELVILQGEITENTTLGAGPNYLLRGAVFVREGATLTLNAGVTIFGEQATLGTLIVDRGARIVVRGTKNRPVVMTSDQEIGQRARGDWGGLIINGRAPLNVPGGEAEGEGDTGTYGGTRPNDDSGSIKYLQIAFAGIEFSPDNELNCLALQGVGRGTVLQYIQCHMNKDDGFEFFGGTALLKYAVASAIGDDSFDATDGWTGAGQYWIAYQFGDDADQGFEIDNNGENNNLTPKTSPTVSHFTLIGDNSGVYGTESDIGMLIREGAAGTWQNGLVMHFNDEGMVNTEKATFNNYSDGSLTVRSMIYVGNGGALARAGRVDVDGICLTDDYWEIREEDGNGAVSTCQNVGYNRPGQNTNIFTSGTIAEEDWPVIATAGENARFGGSRATDPEFALPKNSIVHDGTVPVAPTPSNVTYADGKKFFTTGKKAAHIGAVGKRGRLAKWWKSWTDFETDIVA